MILKVINIVQKISRRERSSVEKVEGIERVEKTPPYLHIIPLVVILFFAFFGCFQVFSQEECKELITKYVESMGKINAPEKGKVYFLHIAIQNKYRQETHAATDIEIKTYLTEGRMLFNSNLMQIYSDTADMFTVIPSIRQIIRKKGISGQADLERQNEALNMQLKLLEGCSVMGCKETEQSKEITLRPSEEIEKQLNVNEIIMYYDSAENRVQKIRIKYSKQSKLDMQIVEYKAINFDSTYKFEKSTAAAYILTESGKLRNEFGSYSLIE